MQTVMIDGVEYRPVNPDSPIKIVILQRGWVMVGRYHRDGERVTLDDARVIRKWGTTKGLGEIALDGPTGSTVLDPAGHVECHVLGVVAELDCVEGKWSL